MKSRWQTKSFLLTNSGYFSFHNVSSNCKNEKFKTFRFRRFNNFSVLMSIKRDGAFSKTPENQQHMEQNYKLDFMASQNKSSLN